MDMDTNELIDELFNKQCHQHDGCGSYSSRPFFEGEEGKEFILGVPYTWTDANAYANPSEGFVDGNENALEMFLRNVPIGFEFFRDDYYGSNFDGFEAYLKLGEDRWGCIIEKV